MFSVHNALEVFKNTIITAHLDLFWKKKKQAGKSHDYCEITVLKNLRFQNAFRPHENEKLVFSNFSCLKSVFGKLRFRDGLVWTVGLALEIKLRFQIPLAYCACMLGFGYRGLIFVLVYRDLKNNFFEVLFLTIYFVFASYRAVCSQTARKGAYSISWVIVER